MLAIAAVSYLLGSIPFGYLLVRVVRGEDVRRSGSGNIGATNVARKSRALGVLTLLLDAAKGLLAVQVAVVISRFPEHDPRLYRRHGTLGIAGDRGTHVSRLACDFAAAREWPRRLALFFA